MHGPAGGPEVAGRTRRATDRRHTGTASPHRHAQRTPDYLYVDAREVHAMHACSILRTRWSSSGKLSCWTPYSNGWATDTGEGRSCVSTYSGPWTTGELVGRPPESRETGQKPRPLGSWPVRAPTRMHRPYVRASVAFQLSIHVIRTNCLIFSCAPKSK
jgi:hypothetical protein